MDIYEQVCTSLEILTSFGNFEQVFTSLGVLTSFDKFWLVLTTFDEFWQVLINFDKLWQVWMNSKKVWKIFQTFKRLNKFEWCDNTGNFNEIGDKQQRRQQQHEQSLESCAIARAALKIYPQLEIWPLLRLLEAGLTTLSRASSNVT